ncbi:hypothetical protein MNEG_15746 [Monoraphidium neglectum]|uniref:HTH OST-type domain-containing protein n=1 Tax=Monoraphidium neglectum TaxID=145388 RepID=A0A0D2IWA0_9CHLO|nr:hypothetical protein MNEG_15746 [Monoraphidium neglectum]KIY92217.1 hypothetical protein MNEG_15746 [Monoraphidium neglectum]|eukprot:XP_013891237.1 hypothetical protein MNEG_15746 [Monoraphidium neglectum]
MGSDLSSLLEAKMDDVVAKQRAAAQDAKAAAAAAAGSSGGGGGGGGGAFVWDLPVVEGYRLDAVKRDFHLLYHYELSNTALGVPAFRHLIEGYGDTLFAKAFNLHSLYLHPSPIYHLRLLLRDLLRDVPPAFGPDGVRLESVAASSGLPLPAVAAAFRARYGYELPLATYGQPSLAHLLGKLQGDCRLVPAGAGGGELFAFPPVAGARSTFNRVRGHGSAAGRAAPAHLCTAVSRRLSGSRPRRGGAS